MENCGTAHPCRKERGKDGPPAIDIIRSFALHSPMTAFPIEVILPLGILVSEHFHTTGSFSEKSSVAAPNDQK